MARKFKEMTADRLTQILLELPDGCTVQPNSVGQLIVNDRDYEVVGYIDFEHGKLVRTDGH